MLLLVVCVVGGWIAGGAGGALAGLLIAGGVVASVLLGALSWAQRVGSLLEPEQARAMAPCPPGFSKVCELAYRRLWEE